MGLSEYIQTLAAGATVLLLLAAAVSDISRYRIPNTIVYAIAAAFVIGAAFNFSWPGTGWSVLAGAGMFLLGAGLFALRLFGGGDVKLVAAMALWTGVADLPRFLLVMTAAGGLLGTVWLIKRRLQPAAFADPAALSSAMTAAEDPACAASPENVAAASKPSNRIPYGVAITIAGLDFFVTSARSPFALLWPWMQ